MKKDLFTLAALTILVFLSSSSEPCDGTILSTERFVPPAYELMDITYKHLVPKEFYQQLANLYLQMTDIVCERIEYSSDGLRVVGLIARPACIGNKQLPVIIYNRGGFGEFGKLDVQDITEQLSFFVRAGYIVLASQYRGNDGSQGKEECGGADIADVLNLFNVARSLPYTDMTNVFMVGFSRGGMMTYLALKHKAPVNAVAVIAGISDVSAFVRAHPEIECSVFNTLIPRIAIDSTGKTEEYVQRSATKWAGELTVPILLLHNDRDPLVPVEQSYVLADLLKQAEKPHKLILYQDTEHRLVKYRQQALQAVVDWFASFAKKNRSFAL